MLPRKYISVFFCHRERASYPNSPTMIPSVRQFCFILLCANQGIAFQESDGVKNTQQEIRHKRSVILLPANTSITITFDLSMPVPALVSQSGFYNMRVPFRFFIPTYNQLVSSYGRTESREDDENQIEHIQRHEQERANEERRFIYKSIESLLSR